VRDESGKEVAFGFYELADGIGVVTIAVGVFAVGEILSNLSDLRSARSLPRR
jgi:TctA family transporter